MVHFIRVIDSMTICQRGSSSPSLPSPPPSPPPPSCHRRCRCRCRCRVVSSSSSSSFTTTNHRGFFIRLTHSDCCSAKDAVRAEIRIGERAKRKGETNESEKVERRKEGEAAFLLDGAYEEKRQLLLLPGKMSHRGGQWEAREKAIRVEEKNSSR